ncbi:Rap1a/Tai family immunity protein [Mesorhizobium sp. KR1-2]|uniref:Rap1a/Tai family immunity protein n=1 Tax=Mesorhizobium sp. KR1-2 TaxID=3156609 RepID=UPI0032B4C1C9
MRSTFLLAITASTIASNSFAMTGAEFLQIDRKTAFGYMAGVVEMRVTVVHQDDESFMRIRDCLSATKLTNDMLYQIVADRLHRNPQELTLPALAAIMNVLADMCKN